MDLYKVRQQLNTGVTLASMKLRVTDYARVSTNHLEQQSSLKNQVEHFEEMIKSNVNWTYVPGYVDEGISGTTDYRRDNFMKMIEDARCGMFDLIVTKEISRFSRNTLDSIKYTRELLSFGVAVLFVNDNINTALPDAELRLTIMASMAQDEIRRLSERVKFGMNRSIKNGTILGNDMLYGYKKDKLTGNLNIIPEEAMVVKRLYSLYAIQKLSITKIAKMFNDEGIKTAQNKKWHPATLTRMLKNPKYKGFYCGKKTEVIDYMTKKVKYIPSQDWVLYNDQVRIPPIVNSHLWQRASARLKSHNKDKIKYQNRYLFSGKIYCQEHNEVFHRRRQCKTSKDITWVCAKYLNEGKKTCDSPNIRESEIYFILDDILNELKIDISYVFTILLGLYDNNQKSIDKMTELKIQKAKILSKKAKLLELNMEGNLSNKEFNIKNNEYNEILTKILNDISKMKQNLIKNKKTNLDTILSQKFKDKEIKNIIIDLLLAKIIVSKISNNKEFLELLIYLNLGKNFLEKDFHKVYEFKRGYNTKCTKRYTIKYLVKLYLNNTDK